MDREQQETDVIALGTASIDTLGQPFPTLKLEYFGYIFMGLLQD